MKFEKIFYPDGTFYHRILDFNEPTITMKINTYNDLFSLAQLKNILDYHKIKNTKLVVPCLLDAQADKRFNINESSNLKIVCKFINDLKFDEVHVFHPHNPEVVEAIIDNLYIIDNSEFIKKVILKIEGNNLTDFDFYKCRLENKLNLLSTDAGGYKPLMKLADKLKWNGEVNSASKSRDFIDNKTVITQLVEKTDFGGKDILIIDDLSVYGGTFIGLSKILKKRNVGKLYLAISHITVEKPSDELWKSFDKVFTTNSKYDNYFVYGTENEVPNNLDILKMF